MEKILRIILGLLFVAVILTGLQIKLNNDNSSSDAVSSSSAFEETNMSSITESTITESTVNETAADVVASVLDEFQVDESQVAITYHNLQNGDIFYLNEDAVMYAASTTKVAIAALFVDLISEGKINWQTELPYDDYCYEEGDGQITNSEKKSSYTVEELIFEMLIHSDNTAANILVSYYIDVYAGTFTDYRQAIAALSGLDNLSPEIYEGNYATAKMLEQTLIHVASDDRYAFIIETMQQAQSDFRFKQYVPDGMAVKYGSYDAWQHDMGIYYSDSKPVYVLVALTNGVDDVEAFLGTLNLRLNEWQEKNS